MDGIRQGGDRQCVLRLIQDVADDHAHVYGSPTFVGLAQPLVKPIPCWTSRARASPGPTLSATRIVAANATPTAVGSSA